MASPPVFMLYRMSLRRFLFALIVGLLITDAAGLEGFLLPEACASVADKAADNDCPATCARCACGQPVIASVAPVMTTMPVHVSLVDEPESSLRSGPPHDVLHVPKQTSCV